MHSLTSLSRDSVSLERVSVPRTTEMRDIEEEQEGLQASLGLGPAMGRTTDKNSMLGQVCTCTMCLPVFVKLRPEPSAQHLVKAAD